MTMMYVSLRHTTRKRLDAALDAASTSKARRLDATHHGYKARRPYERLDARLDAGSTLRLDAPRRRLDASTLSGPGLMKCRIKLSSTPRFLDSSTPP